MVEDLKFLEKKLNLRSDLIKENISDIGESIVSISMLVTDVIKNKGKLMFCGNGGSAADSQHLAAELIGRYRKDRKALPGLALTTDTSKFE